MIESQLRSLGRLKGLHARRHVRRDERRRNSSNQSERGLIVVIITSINTSYHPVLEISITIDPIDPILLVLLHPISILILVVGITPLPLLTILLLVIVVIQASHRLTKVSILPIAPIVIINELDPITNTSILIDITIHPNLTPTRNGRHGPGLLLLIAEPRIDIVHDPRLERTDEIDDIDRDLRFGEIVIVIDERSGQAKSTNLHHLLMVE